MRSLNRLSVKAAKSLGPGKYADGGGLWLHKRPDGGAQWVLRVVVHGKRREMGLGGAALSETQIKNKVGVSLAEAREMAAEYRSMAKNDVDPIHHREQEKLSARRNLHSLSDIVTECFEARKAELKDDGNAGRWLSPVNLHILPKLGNRPVTSITQLDIRDTLAPIWHTKADAARKAMNRLGLAMQHAAALGLDVDLQAVDKAKALLGKTRHEKKKIPALPWQDVPDFYASLNEGSVNHLALRLLILTGVRSKPLRFARKEQFEGDIWTVPAEFMKGRKGKTTDFRVPLSDEALSVFEQAIALERDGYLFPSIRRGVISDATMSRYMERRGMIERPHGFRSSLRTWLSDCTDAPREVAETVLAHKVETDVTGSYQRSDHLERRRVLMQRWADHCLGRSAEIVKLGATNAGN